MLSISQPRWKAPEHSKREINEAGRIIRNPAATPEELIEARAIIDNWRAAHAYPMHVFYMNLRRQAKSRSDVVVAERLKRLDSIVGKLQRETGMDLYRMQDLGGCRVILPTIEEVYSFSYNIQASRVRHERKNIKDYILNPKLSGYRSLHLVYRFKTDTPEKDIFNKYPMLIELQYRTHLQHIWATAVETIGLFTNQALKAGQGDEAIKRFFVLVSSLFAQREGSPIVPGTIDDEKELVSEIELLNDEHHIIEMLSAIRTAVDISAGDAVDRKGYYILQLNYSKHSIAKTYFKPSEVEKANAVYDYLENQRTGETIDTVLVRAASLATVKEAYPNYFMDIGEFVSLVTDYLR